MPFMYDPYTGKPLPPQGYNWQSTPVAQPLPQAQPEQKDPWIMVPTLSDVDKVAVERGETKWIMVQSDPIFAVKTANAMGYAPAEYYRFEQVDPVSLTTQPAVSDIQPLTREDVEKIVDDKAAQLVAQYAASFAHQPTPTQTVAKAKKEVAHE